MRSVSVDPVAQKLAFNRAYKWLDKASAGNRVFVDWMTANTAREQATTNTIQVTLENVFPKGGDTWEMDWSEQKYDLKGVEDGLPSHWYAYVTIAISPPLTEQDAIANPIGMYLETLVWGDRQAGRK
jgi:type IV secretory pathway TrbF-like protein